MYTVNTFTVYYIHVDHILPGGLKTARAFSHFPFGHVGNSLRFPYKSAFFSVIEKCKMAQKKWTENC